MESLRATAALTCQEALRICQQSEPLLRKAKLLHQQSKTNGTAMLQ